MTDEHKKFSNGDFEMSFEENGDLSKKPVTPTCDEHKKDLDYPSMQHLSQQNKIGRQGQEIERLRKQIFTNKREYESKAKELLTDLASVREENARLKKERDKAVRGLRNYHNELDYYKEQRDAALALAESRRCCGNCGWNTEAIIHNKCDMNNWVRHSGNDRGRGFCDNWKPRESGE